jgi:short-subunit dehydrogenase
MAIELIVVDPQLEFAFMYSFHHKTALITGASSGIGEAFAEQLAALQCNLVIVARRQQRLEQLKAKLEQQHGIKVTVITSDLTQPAAANDIYQQLQRQGIQIDVLINNAGLGHHGKFLEVPVSQQLSTLLVNINALTELTHVFAADMKARGQGGAILLVASIAAYTPIPSFATYAASKSYVLSLGQALHKEFKADNIGVTVLAPGGVATEFMDHAGQKIDDWRTKAIMSPEAVAEQSLMALAKGKAVIVPGVLNKASAIFLSHAPRIVKMAAGEMATH